MIHTSITLLLTAYTPRMQHTRIDGYSTGYGTRSRFTNRPTSGRFRINKITLPTYIEAMKPQKRFGSLLISNGPGVTPWTIMAASNSAATGVPGTPRASIGTNAPDVAALLADSGPATPATAPLPNSSGCFDTLRSTAYETNVEITWAEPGMMPIKNPSTVPRQMGMFDSRHSWRDGSSSRRRGLITSGGFFMPAVNRISASPKSPTATGTTPMPSPSSATP